MYSEAVMQGFWSIQKGFQLIAALHLSGFMWPPHTPVTDESTYDFIVVGAGTAGSVLASRLTENKDVSVLLIEAGGDPPFEAFPPATMVFLKNSAHDWNYTSEYDKFTERCHPTPYIDITQGKMLGGTSSLNYHLYGRGSPIDYDTWADKVGDKTWQWKNVLPYFIKSERNIAPSILNGSDKKYHGTEGKIGVSTDKRDDILEYFKSVKEIGHDIVPDINEEHPLGYAPMLFTIADGSRQSTAIAYLHDIKDRPNLHVMKHTLVTKVIFDEKKNAIGVQALTEDGKTITIKAAKEVIVSAGALNTPKLLMLSGIGPKEHLTANKIDVIADLPVGKNLQDHVGVNIIDYMEAVPIDKSAGYPSPHENPASAVVGYAALDKTQKYPDYETMNFLVDAGANITTVFCTFALGYRPEICDDMHQFGLGKKAIFNQIINLKPKSRGQVLLRSSNPIDPPIVHTKYFSVETDLENLVKYVEDFELIYKTSFYKDKGIKMAEPKSANCGAIKHDSHEYWKCYVSCMMTGMSYFCGTSAMGAVVDGRLRVLGISRLRVADASVMPDIPRGNIYAAVVMIGEKAADFVKEEYKL